MGFGHGSRFAAIMFYNVSCETIRGWNRERIARKSERMHYYIVSPCTGLVGLAGIEPTSAGSKPAVLPLNYNPLGRGINIPRTRFVHMISVSYYGQRGTLIDIDLRLRTLYRMHGLRVGGVIVGLFANSRLLFSFGVTLL